MTYEETDLHPTSLTSSAWALAWTRFFLRDTSSTPEFSDTELTAVLEGTSFTPTRKDDNNTYYRPHVAAANILQADPNRALQESVFEASETKRSPERIARTIRRSGRWIDDAIFEVAEEHPTSNRTLRAVY